jgi:hypothetical protein
VRIEGAWGGHDDPDIRKSARPSRVGSQTMTLRSSHRAAALPFAALVLAGVIASEAHAQAPPPAPTTPVATAEPAAPAAPRMGLMLPQTPATPAPAVDPGKASPYHRQKLSAKASNYYPAAWVVDRLRVNYTSSGNLIRFSFRVVEPKRAKALGDHEATPYLVGLRSNVVLQVPTMEKIGQLRQMGANEAGKEYWMVFSNKGNLVRPGDRVNVLIGKFRAEGLVVE